MSAYKKLADSQAELSLYSDLNSLASWDEACIMPAGGGERRGQAMAALSALIHAKRSDPALAELITQARNEPLDEWQQANVDEIDRRWQAANALPAQLVKARSLATTRCEQRWRNARADNDWQAVLPLLEEVVALSREQAQALGDAKGLAPYDALLDGMSRICAVRRSALNLRH